MHLHTHDGQLVSNASAHGCWISCHPVLRRPLNLARFCLSDSVRLVNEFNNMPVSSKVKQGTFLPSSLQRHSELIYFLPTSLTSGWSAAVGDKTLKDIRPGLPFEPTYIYRLLTLIKSSLSEKVRQSTAFPISVTGFNTSAIVCVCHSNWWCSPVTKSSH